MSIERRGPKWRVRYLDGARHRSRTFDLKADAQMFDQEVRRRKQRGSLDTLTATPQTLDAYVEQTWAPVHAAMLAPASRQVYAWAYDTHVSPALGAMALHTITPAVVARWQTRLVAQRLGHETIRKARHVLSGVLRTAVETELLDRNPVVAVQGPRAPLRDEPTVLAPARVEALRRACGPRGAALVSVLAYAGLRPQEARELRWADIGERTLIASAQKTRRRRTVRLLDPLAVDLKAWRMASGVPGDEAPVFPGRDGQVMTAPAFSGWRRTEWRDALKAAGIEPAVPYVLRHGFASLLAHEGRSLVYIARQLGHSVAVCADTYTHVMDELEDAPRISAEDAIRAARRGKVAQRLPTGTGT